MAFSCRLCSQEVTHSVIDLGATPLANAYIKPETATSQETVFPLQVWVCSHCWLVQIPEWETPEQIFSDYAYFSSYSSSWVEHARLYVEAASERFALGPESLVVEVASNDGYLLRHFQSRGVPCFGIEPAQNVAKAAQSAGITTYVEFFTEKMAKRLVTEQKRADLIVGNNVLAQVPELIDFLRGIRLLLKTDGVVTIEFPHFLKTLQKNEFDTVYHEHFSYFSLHSAEHAFDMAGLKVFDVEELATHGGSLRLYGCRKESTVRPLAASVERIKSEEVAAGLLKVETYAALEHGAQRVKRELVEFLERAKLESKTVAAYGAPAKGNTLLNYCGVGSDAIAFTVDRNPHKQGCLLPGTRIPVFSPEKIKELRPDYVLVLPWNLADEIVEQCRFIGEWGGKFVLPIPHLAIV
jgi:SAM-dependent methyltransferase